MDPHLSMSQDHVPKDIIVQVVPLLQHLQEYIHNQENVPLVHIVQQEHLHHNHVHLAPMAIKVVVSHPMIVPHVPLDIIVPYLPILSLSLDY